MNLSQIEQGIGGVFSYRTDLFLPSTAQRMLTCYRFLMHQLFTHADLRVRDIESLLLEQDRQAQADRQARIRDVRRRLYTTGT